MAGALGVSAVLVLVAITLAVGAVLGAVNGTLVVRVGISSFIATLGTRSVLAALALWSPAGDNRSPSTAASCHRPVQPGRDGGGRSVEPKVDMIGQVSPAAESLEVEDGSTIPRRPDAGYAFRVARRTYVAGRRIDMQQLAAELGVDRTTLFRWVGNRDRLMADILISMTDPTIEEAVQTAEGVGGARIAAIARNYAQILIETEFFQTFIRREAERALRLLTSHASPVQAHVVAYFEKLLQQEQDRGNLVHSMSLHDLAYLIVRIMESFIYADMITGDEPDSGKVYAAIAALLHAD